MNIQLGLYTVTSNVKILGGKVTHHKHKASAMIQYTHMFDHQHHMGGLCDITARTVKYCMFSGAVGRDMVS